MKYITNINEKSADMDARSLRARVKDRDKRVLRDTYYLIDRKDNGGPSERLTLGQTTIYPTGSTTGHSHEDMEEVYYIVSGEGTMVVGEDEYPVKAGDALYVPPCEYHTTFQCKNAPLTVVWVTGKID